MEIHYGGITPSPRGARYRDYIRQQMYLLPTGIAAFATRQYGRLMLDKYIQSNRESDETAKRITNNLPSLIMLGGAELHPSRPIGIKNNKRCPGSRKLVTSIKKLGHSAVIFVDEYFTSQTCANCFRRFHRSTRRDRFKVCRNCRPRNIEIGILRQWLPNVIVTKFGKRAWKILKRNAARNPQNGERLVSKVAVYRKNWQPNALNGGLGRNTVVWHRDIVAARCILYKGIFNHSIYIIN